MKRSTCQYLFVTGIALMACACFATTPNLRGGIVSDTQSYPGRKTDWGQKNLCGALRYLKNKKIDVLIYAGDIANNGHATVYREYHEIMDEVFGKEKPETVVIMGNHDFWKDGNMNTPGPEAIATFKAGMKLDSIHTHKVVKGYDFIGLSAENSYQSGWNKLYGASARKFLKEKISAALKRAPERPVFVVTHEPAAGTVYGSSYGGHPSFAACLTPYPGVVHFAGHSHFSLEDERSIHQRDFTAVGTSSLNYCDLEEGRENGPRAPYARECVEFLYMEVFDDRLDLHRLNLLHGCREIKPGKLWSVPLPLSKETFFYTEKRADSRKAPVFPEGAKIEAVPDRIPFTGIRLKFDAATHDDFVHTYIVDLQEYRPDGSWGEASRLLYFSDFARGLDRITSQPVLTIKAKHFKGNSEYRITVSAMESFGKIGNSISTMIRTPERAVIPGEK